MHAGASIVGVGSALSGMDTEDMNTYFRQLQNDIEFGSNKARGGLNLELDMDFAPTKSSRMSLSVMTSPW